MKNRRVTKIYRHSNASCSTFFTHTINSSINAPWFKILTNSLHCCVRCSFDKYFECKNVRQILELTKNETFLVDGVGFLHRVFKGSIRETLV